MHFSHIIPSWQIHLFYSELVVHCTVHCSLRSDTAANMAIHDSSACRTFVCLSNAAYASRRGLCFTSVSSYCTFISFSSYGCVIGLTESNSIYSSNCTRMEWRTKLLCVFATTSGYGRFTGNERIIISPF